MKLTWNSCYNVEYTKFQLNSINAAWTKCFFYDYLKVKKRKNRVALILNNWNFDNSAFDNEFQASLTHFKLLN